MAITWKSRELVRLEQARAVNEFGKACRKDIDRMQQTLPRGGGVQQAIDDRHVEFVRQSFTALRESYLRAYDREGVALTVKDVEEIVDEMRKQVHSLFQGRMELEPRSVGIGFRENLDQVVSEQRHELILAMKRAELERDLQKRAKPAPEVRAAPANQPAPARAPLRVFLCSTYADLVKERELVLDAVRRLELPHHAMEFFGARPEQPIETCLDEVRKSDMVVVVIGHRYGSLVPDREISYSQAEYEEAYRLQRPVLVYFRHGTAEPNAQDAEQQRRLNEFKALLSSRHTVATFEDGQRLSVLVVTDIPRVLTKATQSQPVPVAAVPAASDDSKRPFRTVITLIIRKLERLLEQDLVALFMQANRGRWPGHLEVAPENLHSCIQRAQEFDPDLYEQLNHLDTQLLDPARLMLGRMTQKASDRWAEHPEELATLEAEFKGVASNALDHARAALEHLDKL
jgi:hypothetical protein